MFKWLSKKKRTPGVVTYDLDDWTSITMTYSPFYKIVNSEDQDTIYIETNDGLRLIFKDGTYMGWYLPDDPTGEASFGCDSQQCCKNN